MSIEVDFNITRLFIDKKVLININKQNMLAVQCPPIREYYTNTAWNAMYHLWTTEETNFQQLPYQVKTPFDIVTILLFELGQYDQFRVLANICVDALKMIFDEVVINYSKKQILVGNVTITTEIWDYVVYILKLSCGEKAEQPLVFDSPEAREFYRKQKEMENKIRKIKAENKNKKADSNGVIKNMLAITYSFPSLSFEYLFDQTMAQIHWLQTLAAGEVSYKLNAQAMAAGNMKKGSKLEFFIK